MKRKERLRYYSLYTVIFAVLSFLVFFIFIKNGRSFVYESNFCHFYLPHSHLIDSVITATVQHPHCYYLPDNYHLPHYNLHSLNNATGFCMSLYVIIFMAKHLTEYHLQKKARTSRSGLFLSYIFCFLWKSIQQYWLKHGDSPYQPEQFLNVRHEAVAH